MKRLLHRVRVEIISVFESITAAQKVAEITKLNSSVHKVVLIQALHKWLNLFHSSDASEIFNAIAHTLENKN